MTWIEQQYAGSPGSNGQQTDAAIFAAAPISTRQVSVINFQASNFPAPRTIRWTSTDLPFPSEGEYEFTLRTDDGMRVFIDGVLVFNAWYDQTVTDYRFTKILKNGSHTVVVEYYNDRGSSIAVFDYKYLRFATAPTTPASGSPPPPPPSGPPAVDLSTLVQFTSQQIVRDYTKGTLSNVPSENLILRNLSPTLDLNIAFATLAGVKFTPSTFTLLKSSSQTIVVSFIPSELEKLAVGTTNINEIITVSTGGAISLPPSPPPPPTVPPPPPPPTSTPIAIVITPSVASIFVGETATFSATANGVPISVTWTIEPAAASRTAGFTNPQPVPSPTTTVSALATGTAFIAATIGTNKSTANFVVSNPVVIPPGGPIIPPPINPGQPIPIQPPIIYVPPKWKDGRTGIINYGVPPVGWVYEPTTDAWYDPTDPIYIAIINGGTIYNTGSVPPLPPIPTVPNPPTGGTGGGGSSGTVFIDPTSITLTNLL